MDPLEALRDHRSHTQQARALGRPVAGGSGAVLLARKHHQRDALLQVTHRRVVDRQLLAGAGAIAQVQGHAPLGPRGQKIAQANVRERPAHHHLVVATARAV